MIACSTVMDVHAKVEELKKAIVLFEDMVAKYQILPAALTCTALIKGFCRGGKLIGPGR